MSALEVGRQIEAEQEEDAVHHSETVWIVVQRLGTAVPQAEAVFLLMQQRRNGGASLRRSRAAGDYMNR